ncbi:type 2 lanthipeptide synthetase LanM family protein [Actinoplanes flavus]|uniref:Type 2 lantipeptide synthetase LanM family protein n=1 Tax=Actinoplanes flavus TaxID=2820290 RepID=A0ABS3USA3_9ACTN|nr:type 2 lanthipeptide synthetase LanM family protein [Actinoplanes flavus]MBO3741459.1 type 2 lantipeptide synthetase LanM family protein [Actinoplanes flavus]
MTVPSIPSGGTLLGAGWWAPALALHERIRPGPAAGPSAADPAEPVTARLADLGLSPDAIPALRAEPAACLAARTIRPAWVATAERAVAAAVPASTAEVDGDWRDAFGRVLRPFADDAVERITAGAGPCDWLDLPRVTLHLGTALRRGLVDLAARALVAELHRWGARGRLTGDDERARFLDFACRMASPGGLAGLFTRYPVLARLLAQAADATVTATRELLDRLAADRDEVVGALLGTPDPGPVVAIVAGLGDRHQNGRTVTFVDFADGSRVVYKPRDVTTQVVMGRFIDRLSAGHPELSPGIARTVARSGYGWTAYVAARDLPDRAEAGRFYRRQGALLALLHVLRTTDMHYENVIADAGTPVLIDTETLFNAELTPAGDGDPAAGALALSVYRTALLPLLVIGDQGAADLSGLGGDRDGHCPTSMVDWLDAGTDRMRLVRRPFAMTGSANRPRVAGVDLDPGEYERSIVAGFRQAYDFVAAHRAEFAAAVAACADLEIRVVTRPSWMYATILDETTHPDVLRDALDRDEAFSVLYANRTANPLLAQLVGHEITAMWNGDVPMFLASAGRGELRAPDGTCFPVPLPRAGLAAALDTLAGLGHVDRRQQEWIISATLATRHGAPAHPLPRPGAPAPAPPTNPVVHPDALLTAARTMADAIVARMSGEERINWLGVEHVDGQWLVLPMGASLGTGYLGVALFLAELAAVTGVGRYAGQARGAVAGMPALVDLFTDHPELAETVGWGGLNGLGGIAYGLARLGLLLDDPALRDAAARLAALAGRSSPALSGPGWADGLAGCLAALSAARLHLGPGSASDAEIDCADRLARIADHDDGTLPLSFADGLSGIAWALVRCGPRPEHRAAGRRLAARVVARATGGGAPVGGGWCNGDPGVALAGVCVPREMPAADVTALADGPAHRDLSLCHGELGVLEVLRTIAASGDQPSPAAAALHRRTGRVLEALRRNGPVCGVPGNVGTPGLLTGLAGIGHGLLRLAAPGDVPSVLLLQPALDLASAVNHPTEGI